MTEPRPAELRPGWLQRGALWVDAHERGTLALLTGFYALLVAGQGALKLLWVDELITFYVGRQPGLKGVWHALAAGADPNPPLMHVMVKGSTALLGGSALAIRLPAMLSVLMALLAMWWMLRRWVRPVYALAGLLAFMATRGFDYAYDARSYAPMMGFAMMSLACWMAAGDAAGWRRGAALAGMAVGLAAGISSNYYCVLAFFPIAVGEIVGRRFRVGVWVAMALASLPLLLYLPLIRHNIAEFGPHAWNRPQASMMVWSYLELVEGVFWPVLGLGVFAVWTRRGAWTTPRPELAAVGVLLVYPLLGYAIAVGGAGLISPRCVAPVCCGFGLAGAVLAARAFKGSARAGMATAVLMVVWVGVREGICAGVLWEQRRAFFALRDEVIGAPGEQILVADSSFVLPLAYYAEADRWRIAFPIDFDAIHRFERDDSGEQNLWAGRNGVFPIAIGRLPGVLLKDTRTYVIVGRPRGWLVERMEMQGVKLVPYGSDRDWARVGGVFTPMAHEETRVFLATGPGD